MSESAPPAPEGAPPKKRRGRPPLPPHLKKKRTPKKSKAKGTRVPRSETKVGRARAAALASTTEEDLEELGAIPPRGVGQPTKYRDEYSRIARAMCKLGATDADLAAEFHVDADTIAHWQSKHPKFARALALGKEPADQRVERAFFQRATGYQYTATKIMQYEGKPVIVPYREHVPAESGAAFNWLVNRQPDRWKSRQLLEHTGSITLRDAMSEEQRELDLLKFMAEVRQRRMIDVTPKNPPKVIEHSARANGKDDSGNG